MEVKSKSQNVFAQEVESQNPFSMVVPQKILPTFKDNGSFFSMIETRQQTIDDKLDSTPLDTSSDKNKVQPKFEKKSRKQRGKRSGV